ncbi:SusC/RagA family TonB-linked outer membrane protein [Chitinophaga japonensis]|uniref:TonB-linked SusC/RagA family outer membrane protein n=1 Tax=Chitinophaga japonensis TaxID=104662 RepID=A0A562TFC1_CHIJA|nr:TonB-dependent receptor [Chitinophaga japonensis]TWI91796.1 TonB-linked SusC/RagA family outer membrane protein [Chitinophaga japonensis]
MNVRVHLRLPRRTAIWLLLLLSAPAFAQQQKITGTVTDEKTQTPLPGVTVVVKGTNKGTATAPTGTFSIETSPGATLVFSFVGYAPKEVPVGSSTVLNVALSESVGNLNEVVVTGYGSQSKKDITGAVATVDVKKLLSAPAANVGQALQGRVAGVTVGTDNSPGGNVMVRIRGFGTINDNSPLYIIDGVPTKGNLNTLNLGDIESTQVLKDASASSIYGARAGNGVVIITTLKGKLGKPKLSYDFYYGTQRPGKFLDLLNTQEYANLLWESRINAGNVAGNGNPTHAQFGNGPTPVIPDYIFPEGAMEGDPRVDPANYTTDIESPEFRKSKWLITRANKAGTNWMDEIFDPAPIQNHQLKVSGGSESARYAMSLNYFNQEGILIHTGYKRYSVRANTEFNVTRAIRVGENFQVAYGERIGQPAGNQNEGNPISFAYRMQPIIPVYDIMGNFAGTKGGDLDNAKNPVAALYRNRDNVTKELRLFGNAWAEVDILRNLTARTSIGVDFNWNHYRNFTVRDIESSESASVNSLSINTAYSNTWTWYNTLTYRLDLSGVHHFNFLLGTEAIGSMNDPLTTGRSRFFLDDLDNRYLDAGNGSTATNSGVYGDWRLASEFGKINYNYSEKYLVDFTLRRDRSSRFSKRQNVAYFPAASAGWRISEEPFMKSVTAINDLKLRVGWGRTGNQEIGNYTPYTTFGTNPATSFYDLNGSNSSALQGYELNQFGNPDAKWETTTSTNIGLDATVIKGKLALAVDLYQRKTSDMLFPIEIQYTQGQATNPFRNIATMVNKGIELGLNFSDDAMRGDLTYDLGVNFSAYKNEVQKTDGNPNTRYFGFTTRLPAMTVTQAGHPISSFFGYVIDGIFQSDDDASKAPPQFGGGANNKAGQFRFRDVNGDNKIDANDRTIIGSPHPDFTYGINAQVNYKQFGLTLFAQGVQGNDIFNYVRYWTDFPTFAGNRSRRMLEDSWRPGKTDAKLPQLRSNDVISSNPSTYYLEDGSYLRIKNIQLSYNLPESLLKRWGIERVRVYVQGQNLFTFTSYTGLDPEINLRNYDPNNDRHMGVDEGAYPVAKVYLVGANLSF